MESTARFPEFTIVETLICFITQRFNIAQCFIASACLNHLSDDGKVIEEIMPPTHQGLVRIQQILILRILRALELQLGYLPPPLPCGREIETHLPQAGIFTRNNRTATSRNRPSFTPPAP